MILDAISRWFTPTFFFCILNLVVATIFISSSLRKQGQEQRSQTGVFEDDPLQLFRVPSLLDRVKSFSFSRDRAVTGQYVDTNEKYVIEKVTQGMKDDEDEEMESHVERSKSDACMDSPVQKPTESVKVVETVFKESKGERNEMSFVEDEAIDAKADDFINRFKQQLRLQRIESMLRYARK